MYSDVGGKLAGIAKGPFPPTVYSVALTFIEVSGWVLPSAITIDAIVPSSNNKVACRCPSASEITLPWATSIESIN